MKPKIGQSFWSIYVEDGKIEFDEWRVRSIQRRCWAKPIVGIKDSGYYRTVAYLIRKTEFTWIKRSKKHFDYGWAKNIRPPDRKQLYLADDGDLLTTKWDWLFSTKLQALKNEEKRTLKLSKEKLVEYEENGHVVTVEEQAKSIRKNLSSIRRAISRERKKIK